MIAIIELISFIIYLGQKLIFITNYNGSKFSRINQEAEELILSG